MNSIDRKVLDIVGGFIYNPKTDLYLLVLDPKRGIKFYSETIEPGERRITAFKRGLREEAGAIIKKDSLEQVLEYTAPGMRGDDLHKTVYYAEVSEIGKPTKPGEAEPIWVDLQGLRKYRTNCKIDYLRMKNELNGSTEKLRLLQYQQNKLSEADLFLDIIENRVLRTNR